MQKKQDFSLFKKRRQDLISQVKQEHKGSGMVMLIAGFEHDRARFWQESSFFYYTGIVESGAVLTIDLNGHTTLYIPNCGDEREKWVHSPVKLTQENAKHLGVDTVTVLGDRCAGYQLFPYFKSASYGHIIALLEDEIQKGNKIFTLYPPNEHEYMEQRLVVDRLQALVKNLHESIIDISPLVAQMRRRKDMLEIDYLSKAIEITELAQEAAAQAIENGILECEVQASVEYMMTGAQSRPAFPSIVATGKNATTLHYQENNHALQDGQLVVVDIGATWQGYCADITRTYPVSGKFTKRQKELYTIVLDCQKHIEEKAVPGMYLNNPNKPEKSLQHLAVNFFKKHGLEKYFIHGIGHFLGLDVHDVGDRMIPLQEGDVFTIEPGLYLPEEQIGIRIEDDYWMAKKGCIALSENLPKSITDIEAMVQQSFDDHSSSIEEEIAYDDFEDGQA